MHQVLLVEDDIDLANTISTYLELENIQCDFACNGLQGLNLALEGHYDVIILDINLPRMNGLEVCQKLRAAGVATSIIMLTAKDTIDDKLAGFENGTDDYLVKPFAMPELVARVKALANRGSLQSKLCCADLVMDLQLKTVSRKQQVIALSPTGWKILEVLLRATPNVVSKGELEQQVWQGTPPDSDSLKVHLYRLRKKIDKPFSHHLIHTVPNHGFAIRSSDDQA